MRSAGDELATEIDGAQQQRKERGAEGTEAEEDNNQKSPGGNMDKGHHDGEQQQQQQQKQQGHKQQQLLRPSTAPWFREKHFRDEAPMLEQYFDLNAGKHVVLFNFFAAVFVLAVMAAWAQDFQRYGNPLHHLWLIAWNFRQLPQTLLVWSAMFCSTIVCPFYGFRIWHRFLASQTVAEKSWTTTARGVLTMGYTVYQLAFFYYSIRAIFWLNLRGACSFIITCENTRIAMKIHSFFRENLAIYGMPPHQQQAKNVETTGTERQPSLEQFVYFMFCPTFIYRNAYPQSPTRSWRKVCRHLAGCLASMYLVSLCFSQWIIPHFSALSYPEDMRVHLLLATLFPSVIPGSIALFLGIFYGLLHSWLSMFAEALRFGDRRFYANWWSSRNMAEYYRNWNLVVHDWLYAYIYRDISMLLGKRWGPAVSQCLVFFLSSFFHEYWFAVSLRMFYPAIFTLYFIFGGIFFLISRLIKRPYIWNTLMWWNLLFGTGLFVVCYASEWYARQRCAQVYQNALVDTIVPRSWTCLRIS